MYEYIIMNNATQETEPICGYNYEDACERWSINAEEYTVVDIYYID